MSSTHVSRLLSSFLVGTLTGSVIYYSQHQHLWEETEKTNNLVAETTAHIKQLNQELEKRVELMEQKTNEF